MKSSRIAGIWIAAGFPLLFWALFFQTVTLVSGRYGGVLMAALVLTALADVCFVRAFRLGGVIARCLSAALLLPSLFVLFDFARRAPGLFR